ncbi:MAG: hypothetical protein GX059_01615 [Clostridiales bacterium]|jgi:energy-coupling factor transport system substrate-specific component|nr:hypothetical protein [Clostridiales bacterium]
MRPKDIVIIGIMSAILIIAQVALSFIPNVELVSLLVILFSLLYGWKTLFIIYVFVLVEGLIYGFGIWWINYLYVWTILMLAAMLFKKQRSPFFWAILSGTFGLIFGTLCSIPYLFIGGVPMAVSQIISGIPFDVIHCVGNYAVTLALFNPLYRFLEWVNHKGQKLVS